MRQGQAALGAGMGLGSILAAETLSQAGYDFLLLDYQHGAWDDQTIMLAIRAVLLGRAVPMVRVQQNDYYTIGRSLDRGAMGIIVPMVNSAEEARAAARAVRYPPVGGRSMGPFATSILGGDYVQRINDEVFLAVQIESQTAAEHAEEILAVEGVDGCWIGPADLGLSMGVDLATPAGRQAHEAAILGVLAACRKTGKIPGIAGNPATAKYWLDKGFLFVTVAVDAVLLSSGAAENLKSLGR
jgi:4-hydroxy-2-oxoheptanedioate aldolase